MTLRQKLFCKAPSVAFQNFGKHFACSGNISGDFEPFTLLAPALQFLVPPVSHLEASGNCTTIYFNDGTRYLDTRTLKIYENILNPAKFFRIHKSHIINLNNLAEYINEDGHFAVLKNGLRIPVARNRVTDFVKMLKEG